MTKVERENLVPVYCCIPETWELPEMIHYEDYHQFVNECTDLIRKGRLKANIQDELIWRNQSVAELWVENFNASAFNQRCKLGTFWISSHSAVKNMIQTPIALLRTVHPQEVCSLPEGELELVAISNWIGLHKILNIPFFLDFETHFREFGAIAIPLEKFHQLYRIQEREGLQHHEN